MFILCLFALYNMEFYTNTNYVYQLRNEGSNLYAATSGGLSIFSMTDNSFATYTSTEGLPSNWVSCLEIDQDKNIWIGTNNGVGIMKADRSAIVRLPQRYFPSLKVNTIRGSNDTLYVGTEAGLLFINTAQTPTDTSDDERKIVRTSNGLNSDTVLSLAANKYIWVGTMNGITRFDKTFETITYYLGNHQIKAMAAKDTINVYVGTDKGLYVSRDTNIDTLMRGWSVCDLALRNDSLFIVIPSDLIIYIISKDSFMIRNESLPPGIRLKSVTTTSSGWAVGLGNRHPIFDNTGEGIATWDNGRYHVHKRHCIPSNAIADVAVSSNGRLFVALGPRGGIGAITSGIAVLKDDSTWQHITKEKDGIPTDMVHRCDADKTGRVWFVGNWEGGAFFYDVVGDSWVHYNSGNSPIGSDIGWDLGIDDNNNVFFSMAGPADRVIAVDSSLTTWTQLNPSSLGHASQIEPTADGGVYVAFKNEGLLYVDTRNTIDNVNDDTFRFYTEEEGLPSMNCQSVKSDREGRVFVATELGVALFHQGSNMILDTKTSGLINNDCIALTIDAQNRVWILTRAGISIYQPYLNTWQRLGFSENNLTITFSQERLDTKAFLFDPYHNCIWFGSRSGLLRIAVSEPERSDLDSALVYPNPLTRNDHALVFKKLPSDAIIYIYSLSGRLIRKLDNFDPTIGGFIWFRAEGELSSGLYFALAKTPRGKKVLKFAVVK